MMKLVYEPKGNTLSLSNGAEQLHFSEFDRHFLFAYLGKGANRVLENLIARFGKQEGTRFYQKTRLRLARFLESGELPPLPPEVRQQDFPPYAETPLPLYTTIFLTYNCTNKCRFCDYGNLLASPASPSPLEFWKSNIDLIASLGGREITFTGGEPHNHHDFFSIAQYAVSSGFDISICTRKPLQEKDRERIYELKPSLMMISLDTVSFHTARKLYETNTNPSLTLEYISALREHNIPVDVSAVILPRINDDVVPLVKACRELGVRNLLLTHPRGMEGENLASEREGWKELGRTLKMAVTVKQSEGKCDEECRKCGLGSSRLILNPEGKMLYCDQPFAFSGNHTHHGELSLENWSTLAHGFQSWLSGELV